MRTDPEFWYVPDDYSTGCDKCDLVRGLRAIAWTREQLMKDGSVIDLGQRAPCPWCGKLEPIYGLAPHKRH
jgi:hypothetical protein